mmetsp:Transcript_24368/g.76145  ORF Transcript_24368/g.76145 Transcript_24368/m.76145 type:complete len:334 (-) Transcript_24368:27-1028(-)
MKLVVALFAVGASARPPATLVALFAVGASALQPPRPPAGFAPPEPKPLQIGDSDVGDLLSGGAALALRLATGTFVLGWRPCYASAFGVTLFGDAPADDEYRLALGPVAYRDDSSVLPATRPAKPVILYEYESSPFCRKVREICCLLDIECEMRPVPGARQGAFAQKLAAAGGKMTVPYLEDPNNADKGMYESDDIVEYLLDEYGPPRDAYDSLALWPLKLGPFQLVTSTLAAIARGLPCGARRPDARPDNEAMKPLEMWGYETSPFVRPVRETLCALTLPHVVVPCARGSANRDRMVRETGRFQVPFLRDPNTGVELFESAAIVAYLDEVYTV